MEKINAPNLKVEVYPIHNMNADSVAIRHEIELKDGSLELSKKGTIRFTHYRDSSQR